MTTQPTTIELSELRIRTLKGVEVGLGTADPSIQRLDDGTPSGGSFLVESVPEETPKAWHADAQPGTATKPTGDVAEHGRTIFSEDRMYRYTLWRDCGGLFDSGYAMFIGLNPSTADETNDDPTIRRCIAFARAWGFGALCMTNLFAYRATDPKDMLAAADPIGHDNDYHLQRIARNAGVIVAAWGTHGTHLNRHLKIKALIPNLHYLKLTKEGHPGHPLYLPKDLAPIAWWKS